MCFLGALRVVCVIGASLALAGACHAKKSVLPAVQVSCGGIRLEAEVASTPPTRELGLMFREKLEAGKGMLFVFPEDTQLSFWMRNTYVPLSIAFLDAGRRIINIEDMAPLDEQSQHRSHGPARFAIEVPKGWFGKVGIATGATCTFDLPPSLEIR